ncbi:hypothetical protein J6590_093447, partial [Homalodisca vitripennis]
VHNCNTQWVLDEISKHGGSTEFSTKNIAMVGTVVHVTITLWFEVTRPENHGSELKGDSWRQLVSQANIADLLEARSGWELLDSRDKLKHDNLVEIFDDDSDADPDFVVSEHDSVSDGDIEISQPGPSTSTKRKIFSSTPKKHLSHKKPRLCVHNQQDKTITLDSQNTSDNQSWKPVDSTFNVYPYNPENEAVGINPDIIDSMSNCSPIDFFSAVFGRGSVVITSNRNKSICPTVFKNSF